MFCLWPCAVKSLKSFFKELNYWVKFDDWKHTRTNSAAAFWCQTEVRKGYQTVFLKCTSVTYQNIQLCETRVPYSKLVRLRSRKRLHQQLVPHMLYGQNNNKKNQFLKHCIKICWALQSDYSNFQKETVAQSWAKDHVAHLLLRKLSFYISSQANFDSYNGTGKIRRVSANYILQRFFFIEFRTEAIHISHNSENIYAKT